MHTALIRFRLLVALIAAACSAACLTPVLMSSSSPPLAGRSYQEVGATTGESCMDSILGIPLSTDASLHTALGRARTAVRADALIDVVVDRRTLFTLFYNRTCTVVHATGVRFTGARTPAPEPRVPGSKEQKTPTARPAPAKETEQAPAAAAKDEKTGKQGTNTDKQALKKKKKKKKSRKARKTAKKAAGKKAAAQARRKAEQERRKEKEERERKKKAEQERRKKAEQERKNKLEREREKQELARKKAEERKPVPAQYKIFCKYQSGDPVRVETKSKVIEAAFVKCVHFGVRVRRPEEGVGVIPFEDIWTVRKITAAEPDHKPAPPRKPARPE